MHKRDFSKKKAMLDRKKSTWDQYSKRVRTINEIKKVKRKYFVAYLEISKSNPKKTWHSINELSSRRSSKVGNSSEIKIAWQITTEPLEEAEELTSALFNHWCKVGLRNEFQHLI